jgi:hypothetical protein
MYYTVYIFNFKLDVMLAYSWQIEYKMWEDFVRTILNSFFIVKPKPKINMIICTSEK